MMTLADVLDHFNEVDDEEVLRLYEQAKAILARVQGRSSRNVAVCEQNLGVAYRHRARRARVAYDLDRAVTNLELALLHSREAVRIFRVINQVDAVDINLRNVAVAEEGSREVQTLIAAQAAGVSRR